MSYVPTKPDSGPSPDKDTTTIQTNFAQFASIFTPNHIALNAKHQGEHALVVFQSLATDPGVNQNLVSLYGKVAAQSIADQPQLFFRIQHFLGKNKPNAPMQLTYNSVNTSGPIYQTFLPGGYVLYFGFTSASLPTQITLTPVPTTLLDAWAAVNTYGGGNTVPYTASTVITSNSQFLIRSNASGAYRISWMAIGTQ